MCMCVCVCVCVYVCVCVFCVFVIAVGVSISFRYDLSLNNVAVTTHPAIGGDEQNYRRGVMDASCQSSDLLMRRRREEVMEEYTRTQIGRKFRKTNFSPNYIINILLISFKKNLNGQEGQM